MNIKPIMTRVCVLAVLMILISQNRMIIADASVSEPESGARDAISVVMDDNYPPYVFRDEEGTLKGILIDQWDLWSRKTGIEAAVTAMSWPDAVNAMKNGGYDVIDTVFHNEERDEWLDFSAPYASIDVAVFHDKNIGGITDMRSLRGFSVAVKAEDNSIQMLRQNGISDIAEYPSYEAIIDAAKEGETRLFIMDEPPAIYLLHKKQIADQFNKSVAVSTGEFHRAVKSGDAAMLSLISEGFGLISQAEYRAIDETWFGRANGWQYSAESLRYLVIGLAAAGAVILFIVVWNHRLRRAVQRKTSELHQEKELINVTIHSIRDGVIATDTQGRITLINPAAQSLTGWGEDALGLPASEVLRLVDEATGEAVISPIDLVLKTGETATLSARTAALNRQGDMIPVADSASPIRDEKGQLLGAALVLRDFREEKEYRSRLEYIMSHDSMTGLYNRWYTEEALNRYEREPEDTCALIMGDLNGLKLVNDAFGHLAGDRMIQKVAGAMRESCGPDDIVGRWGGDEFLMILPKKDAKEAEAVIERVTAACKEQSEDISPLSIAMGFAVKNGPEDDIHAVLREAEQLTYRRKLMDEKSFRNSVINALLSTLSAKSEETQEHVKRLQDYCRQVGETLNISPKELEEITLLSMMHDIGKVGIKDSILQKPGPLTDDEWLEMRTHPEIGYRIALGNMDLAPIAEYILAHHERWDGAGYPRGLSREEIPMLSRILSVVDAFDAMTNTRVYRQAVSKPEAAEEIMKNAGTQFDPKVARVFIQDVLAMQWKA